MRKKELMYMYPQFQKSVGTLCSISQNAFFLHLTAVSGVGSSPALAKCETSQVLLGCVLACVFSRDTPVIAPPTNWPVS